MLRSRFGIILVTVLIIAVAAVSVLFVMQLDNTMETMAFIESRIAPNNTFTDHDQSICVESSKDIGWWKEGKNWYVQFGKLRLEFTPENLQDPEFLAQVARINLDIRGDLEAGELSFFWAGEELEEWVPY